MKKIPTIFERDWNGNKNLVLDIPVAGAAWVFAGEGTPTLKWDGTACLWKDSKLWKRYDAKGGKTPPLDFVPAMDLDHKTGHWAGWIPVKPEDKWHVEAMKDELHLEEGKTYELVGPKINGNPHKAVRHMLIRHGVFTTLTMADFTTDWPNNVPRTFEGLKIYLEAFPMEGIVWHHPDGRMAKIKRRDFGYPWPMEKSA